MAGQLPAALQAQLQQLLGAGGGPTAQGLLGYNTGRPGVAGAGSNAGVKNWDGLKEFDEATKHELGELLKRLTARGVKELTVLLLGKPGAGKTSTMNSIFNETASAVAAFRAMPTEVEIISRTSNGFTLTFIDTPGLTGHDEVSQASLDAISHALQDKQVDIVLYVERLDAYRTTPLDLAAVKAVTKTLGRDVWNNTIITLTHAALEGLPAGASWEHHVERRSKQVQDLVRKGGGYKDMPVALVENRKEALREGVELPDESMWLPDLVDMMVQARENEVEPYHLDVDAPKKASPNRRRKWLIPLLFAAQVALKLFVIDRVIEDDACTGDQYGPFDEATVKANREQLSKERAAKKQAKEDEEESEDESSDDDNDEDSDDDAGEGKQSEEEDDEDDDDDEDED